MDPLSITAGILAIVTALSGTVRAVNSLIETPHDLEDLLLQLQQLALVAARATEIVQASQHQPLDTAFLDAVLVRLRDVQHKFETRILARDGTHLSAKFGRAILLRRRTEIKLLTKEVASIRTDLGLALTLSMLISINSLQDHCVSLTCHGERLRTHKGNCIAEYDGLHSALDHLTYSNETREDAKSVLDQDKTCLTLPEPLSGTATQTDEETSDTRIPLSCHRTQLTGSLERFRTFYPEQYIVEQAPRHRLMIFSMTKLYQTTISRADKYYFLFPKTARHWRKITVIATTSAVTRQSEVSAVRSAGYKMLLKYIGKM